MLDAVLSGLALAGVSGLTWLAYNHPAEFKPLSSILIWVGVAIYFASAVGIALFGIVALQVHQAVLDAGYTDAAEVAWKAFGDAAPDFKWGLIITPLFCTFILGLRFWVTKLRNEKGDGEQA